MQPILAVGLAGQREADGVRIFCIGVIFRAILNPFLCCLSEFITNARMNSRVVFIFARIDNRLVFMQYAQNETEVYLIA